MTVYKILRADEWAALREDGATKGAPIDRADGYVHLSTAEQVRETARRHFAGEDGLMLLAVLRERLNGLRWEAARGGEDFPHLYGPLPLAAVEWAMPLPLEDGAHRFPEGIP